MEIVGLIISGSIGIGAAYLLGEYDKIKTKKNFNVNDIEYNEISNRKYSEVNYDRLPENIRNEIKIYESRLKNNIDEEYLTNFYNNINTLKVNVKDLKVRNILTNSTAVGYYIPFYNSMKISDEHKDCIFHELNHLSSSVRIGNKVFSGFSQTIMNGSKRISVGNGINEGYTELLAQRDFSDLEIGYGYDNLQTITMRLELIIGEEKMRKLYYSANLYGLIDEMKKYSEIEDIKDFINNTDYIINVSDGSHLFEEQSIVPKLNKANKEIYEFLLKMYLIKLNYLIDNKLITSNEAKKLIREFDGVFSNHYFYKGVPHKFYDNEEKINKTLEIEEYIKNNSLSLNRRINSN